MFSPHDVTRSIKIISQNMTEAVVWDQDAYNQLISGYTDELHARGFRHSPLIGTLARLLKRTIIWHSSDTLPNTFKQEVTDEVRSLLDNEYPHIIPTPLRSPEQLKRAVCGYIVATDTLPARFNKPLELVPWLRYYGSVLVEDVTNWQDLYDWYLEKGSHQ